MPFNRSDREFAQASHQVERNALCRVSDIVIP